MLERVIVYTILEWIKVECDFCKKKKEENYKTSKKDGEGVTEEEGKGGEGRGGVTKEKQDMERGCRREGGLMI